MTKNNICPLPPYSAFMIPETDVQVTGAYKKKKQRERDWHLVASYFTITSMDIFCSAPSNVALSHLYTIIFSPSKRILR